MRKRLQALFTCFSRFLSSSSSFEAAADLPRHLLVMPICIENTQHRMHDVTHLLQQLLFLFIINVVSLCSITFSSSVYLDCKLQCNGQQIMRIATVLLTCSISFSFLSSTNVVGHHHLLSTTLIRSGGTMQSQAMGNGQLPLASCQSDSHSIRLSDLVRLFLLVSVPPKALSPSHQPRLPVLLHWPSTRNAFMLMGISYSLNITNTAVKSTTYRHLLLLLIFIASCCFC